MANGGKGALLLAPLIVGLVVGCGSERSEGSSMATTSSFGDDWRSAVTLLSGAPARDVPGKAFPVGTTLVCHAEPGAGADAPSPTDFELACDVQGAVHIAEGKFDYRRLALPPLFADQYGRAPALVSDRKPGRFYYRLSYKLDAPASGASPVAMEMVVSAGSDIFADLKVGIMSPAYPETMASIVSAHEASIAVESVRVRRLG